MSVKFISPILNQFYQNLLKNDTSGECDSSTMSDGEIMGAFLLLLKMVVGALPQLPPSLKYVCTVLSQKVCYCFCFIFIFVFAFCFKTTFFCFVFRSKPFMG